MKQKISRGMHNNNQNIRHGKSRWQGMADYQPDKVFVTFQILAYDYRATWVLIDNYRFCLAVQGLRYNVSNIIRRWASPADDNDTTAYVATVACISNLDSQVELPPTNTPEGRLLITRLIAVMTCVECGLQPDRVEACARTTAVSSGQGWMPYGSLGGLFILIEIGDSHRFLLYICRHFNS